MNRFRLIPLLAALALLSITTACTTEGLEGDATVHGVVAHHNATIGEATVFVKFGAKDYPGSLVSDYDMSVLADTGGAYTIENLKKGDYYLFGFGYDSTISQTVSGGIHIEVAKGEDKTVDVAVIE